MSHNTNVPGLDCPECSSRIPMTIPKLLSGSPFYCGNCGLKIEVDTDRSSYALDRLQVFQDRLNEADRMARKALDDR